MKIADVDALRARLLEEGGEDVALALLDKKRKGLRVKLVPDTEPAANLFVRAQEYDRRNS